MAAMNTRQSKLLSAIIEQFIQTAIPIGSKAIIEMGKFDVSGATIRNEMQALSEEGFIEQPHISAGRVPTALGYRVYVKKFMEPTRSEKIVRSKFDSLKEQYYKRKDQERVYEAVTLLSHMAPNIAFATVPHRENVFFMGFHNVLKQPEFQQDAILASNVAEVLETKLSKILGSLDIDENVHYFIGEENILEEIVSCSMLVCRYNVRDTEGCIGILGPMRMDYAYNTIAIECAADMLRAG